MAKIKKITMWQIATGVLAVLLVVSIFTSGFGGTAGGSVSKDAAVNKAMNYINENILQDGTSAELKESSQENGLYKFKIAINGQEYDSYVSPDGQMLFTVPGIDMDEEIPEATTQQQAQQAPADMPKSGKPEVELFVMSHCPYGTQIEKGIIPVVKLLGDKIDFNIRFVNYAMHGEKEVDEEINQYCIETEQNSKFLPYLECFLGEGDGEGCLDSTNIDKSKLSSCLEATEEKYKIKELFADQETWVSGRFPQFPIYDDLNIKYGVRGSPTLVINGQQVSSGRSSAALLATICNAFEDAPAECGESVDSTNPSPGFGYSPTGAATATAATCG